MTIQWHEFSGDKRVDHCADFSDQGKGTLFLDMIRETFGLYAIDKVIWR